MTADSPDSARDHIFISYRRDDARGASGRLYDWLRIGFGRDHVFRDVHSLGVGKWRDKINAALARSAVCVAVIGPRWANVDNLPRLNDKDDMVRHELVTALDSTTITLVPTLVEGLTVKDVPTEKLPSELQPLFAVWNAREVTEGGWEDDTRRLIAEIAEASGLPVGPDLDTLLHNAARAAARGGTRAGAPSTVGPHRSAAPNRRRAEAQARGSLCRRSSRSSRRVCCLGTGQLTRRRRRLGKSNI